MYFEVIEFCFIDVQPCPELESISNGHIVYVPDREPKYFFGTLATYVCNFGFGLTLSLDKECVADFDTFNASWNSTDTTSCNGEHSLPGLHYNCHYINF